MLDSHSQLDLPPDLGLVAYRDTEDPDLLYAVPAAPSVARTPDGGPAVSLMVYLHKTTKEPFGGQVSLTVDLGMGRSALEKLAVLARRPAAPGEPEPPPPRVTTPYWLDGHVRVELLPGLACEGSPSMVGDNNSSLTLEIPADRITEFLAAWDDGLPDARTTYEVSVQSAVRGSAAARLRFEDETAQYRAILEQHVSAGESQAVALPLTIAGPLRLTAAELTAARTNFEL